IVSRRGVVEGVGSLTPEQVKQRGYSYKITSKGGRVEKVEAVNAKDLPTSNHHAGTHIDDPNAGLLAPQCGWECRYKDNGAVAEEVAFDRNGQVVWAFVHVSETDGYYKDSRGFARARSGAGASHVGMSWDEGGFLKEEHYFDKDGKPSPDGD